MYFLLCANILLLRIACAAFAKCCAIVCAVLSLTIIATGGSASAEVVVAPRLQITSGIQKYLIDETIVEPARSLERRGQALRNALENEYHRVLRRSGPNVDVTDVVLPFISNGMPFANAEAILRAAGFAVGRRPQPSSVLESNRNKEWYAVIASIEHFKENGLVDVSAYVTLLPKSPDDYTVVDEMKAVLFFTMP